MLWIHAVPLITLMRIRIRIFIDADADTDPTFQPIADPDTYPDPNFQKKS